MSIVVTTRLDADTIAGLDKLAEYHERSRAWLIAKAVKQYVQQESEFFAFLQEGEDDFAHGDFITHEAFMAELKADTEGRSAARGGEAGQREAA